MKVTEKDEKKETVVKESKDAGNKEATKETKEKETKDPDTLTFEGR